MNPTVGIAVILTVLQAAHCQMIKDLSACLLGQNLRVDCRYENKTDNPLTYEFSITKDNRKHVIHSTISVSENIYRSRANVTMHKNLVCLHLQSFTTSDEGVYMCELKATNDYTGNQSRNITVIKDKLEKCAGFSLLIQNTSWLLLLLLSLPLLCPRDPEEPRPGEGTGKGRGRQEHPGAWGEPQLCYPCSPGCATTAESNTQQLLPTPCSSPELLPTPVPVPCPSLPACLLSSAAEAVPS
uniref:Thy-1 membrane glycoprotein n=1 Tax=Catharus ustulatus TaxID=91951 RepID=A0A8C3VE02_CATUS